jgi:hypothetical protein
MILYTNGCSWTWGGELENYFINDDDLRQKLVWPYHLGLKLKSEKTINLSAGCGSNTRIFRTTFDWLSTQSKDDLRKTVAIIQFSDWSRFEVYDQLDKKDHFENHQERWLKCKTDLAIYTGAGMEDVDESFIKLVNDRIAMSAPIEHIYNTISLLYAFKGLFDSYGVKNYYFWQLGNLWSWWPDRFKKEIFSNFKIVDDNPNEWKYSRVSQTNTHPDLAGHKAIASIIYNNMIEKGYEVV